MKPCAFFHLLDRLILANRILERLLVVAIARNFALLSRAERESSSTKEPMIVMRWVFVSLYVRILLGDIRTGRY